MGNGEIRGFYNTLLTLKSKKSFIFHNAVQMDEGEQSTPESWFPLHSFCCVWLIRLDGGMRGKKMIGMQPATKTAMYQPLFSSRSAGVSHGRCIWQGPIWQFDRHRRVHKSPKFPITALIFTWRILSTNR